MVWCEHDMRHKILFACHVLQLSLHFTCANGILHTEMGFIYVEIFTISIDIDECMPYVDDLCCNILHLWFLFMNGNFSSCHLQLSTFHCFRTGIERRTLITKYLRNIVFPLYLHINVTTTMKTVHQFPKNPQIACTELPNLAYGYGAINIYTLHNPIIIIAHKSGNEIV